jgi:predicted metal-dependent hydrolase
VENIAVSAERTVFRWAASWLRDEALAAVQRHADRSSLHPRLIRIKRMRTRWGSCGARNDINLNWLLTFVPPEVLEYVVVHELCHIRHRDHSPRFWNLVADHLPGYARERHWLKMQGGGLIAQFGQVR